MTSKPPLRQDEIIAYHRAGVGYFGQVYSRSPGQAANNVIHAVICTRFVEQADAAYCDKYWYATETEAIAGMTRECGAGNFHLCGLGCCRLAQEAS
jgi:hypothetical protein